MGPQIAVCLCAWYGTALWLAPSSVRRKSRKWNMGVPHTLVFSSVLWNRGCTFSGLSGFRNEALIRYGRTCYRFQSENLESHFSFAYHRGEMEKVSYLSTLIPFLWKEWNFAFLTRTTGLKFLTTDQPADASHITAAGPIQNLTVPEGILAGTDRVSALQRCVRKTNLDESDHRQKITPDSDLLFGTQYGSVQTIRSGTTSPYICFDFFVI